jgi:hypothetical protein
MESGRSRKRHIVRMKWAAARAKNRPQRLSRIIVRASLDGSRVRNVRGGY